MDLEIEADISKTVDLLRSSGLAHVALHTDNSLEAKLPRGLGRLHVLGKQMDSTVFLDIHWDFVLHFAFLGVDYSKRPKELCDMIITYATRNGLRARIIGGTGWFTRRNRAIVRGLKL